jgi:hypothetical protein
MIFRGIVINGMFKGCVRVYVDGTLISVIKHIDNGNIFMPFNVKFKKETKITTCDKNIDITIIPDRGMKIKRIRNTFVLS